VKPQNKAPVAIFIPENVTSSSKFSIDGLWKRRGGDIDQEEIDGRNTHH